MCLLNLKLPMLLLNKSPTHDKHSKPEMVPRRHHTKPNKSKMIPPSAPPMDTEPISLELFNRAATDLDTKGEIQLSKYRKVLESQDLKMEEAYIFAQRENLWNSPCNR